VSASVCSKDAINSGRFNGPLTKYRCMLASKVLGWRKVEIIVGRAIVGRSQKRSRLSETRTSLLRRACSVWNSQLLYACVRVHTFIELSRLCKYREKNALREMRRGKKRREPRLIVAAYDTARLLWQMIELDEMKSGIAIPRLESNIAC